jgi:5-methoxy-6-methylbenzimidazole methyltransferase
MLHNTWVPAESHPLWKGTGGPQPSWRSPDAGMRRGLDVLFVDLPFNTYELGRRFKAAWSYKQFLSPYELHLGFRYMVSSLRAAGHSANIVFPAEENRVTTKADLVRAIAEIRPLVLGFTSYEGSLREALQFIRRVRASGVSSLVCLGGHLATFSYEEVLRDHHDLIDLIVLGDGEQAIVDIVSAIKERQGFGHIPGLAYFEEGRLVTTPRRPIETNIDRLPFPLLPEMDGQAGQDIPLFVTTSRGCYAHCSFCRSSHFGERWRARDPYNVVDEIEAAYARGITTFEMVDDNFLGPGAAGKRRAAAIAAEIRRRGLKISYHISCRVNDVDEPTMRVLKESGLFSVSLGVESGVQRILNTFNKKTTVDQNVAALQVLQGLGIPTLAYIIFFDPYMTLAEVQENVQFLKALRGLDNVRFEAILFRKLIPISGTDLFERIRNDGLLRGNYLSGHHFVFQDRRVSLLADFMEEVDLRFEAALQNEQLRAVGGLYSVKHRLQFRLAEKAIELLASGRFRKAERLRRLQELLVTELHQTFGYSPEQPAFDSPISGQGGESHGDQGVQAQTQAGVRRGAESPGVRRGHCQASRGRNRGPIHHGD